MKDIILITTCVSQKHLNTPNELFFRNTPEHTTPQSWKELLNSHKSPQMEAIDLYKGSLWDITKTLYKDNLISELYIISAGYGVISPNEKIRPYSLSFRQNSFDSTHSQGFTSKDWWDSLCPNKPLNDIILSNPDSNIVLYGSQPYIQAISNELKTLPPVSNLFIVAPDVTLKSLNRYLVKPPFKMRFLVGGNKITTTMKSIDYMVRNLNSLNWSTSYLNSHFNQLTLNYPDVKEYKETLPRKGDDFFLKFIPTLLSFTQEKNMKSILKDIRSNGYAMGENRLCRLLEKLNNI